MTDQELWQECWNEKCSFHDSYYPADIGNCGVSSPSPVGYAELGKDVTFIEYFKTNNGWVESQRPVPAGTTVKAVGFSELGDICITDNFESTQTYKCRVMPGDGILVNCRRVR